MQFEIREMTKEEAKAFQEGMRKLDKEFQKIYKERKVNTKKNGFKNGNERTNREFT